MKMIKINKGGITMIVPEADVDFYKRAGYEVVKDADQAEETKLAGQDEKPTKGKRKQSAESAE